MESSSSRFRFRDLPEMENCTQSDSASDLSSVSSDRDDESDLQSMTGKGIKASLFRAPRAKGCIQIFEEVGHVLSKETIDLVTKNLDARSCFPSAKTLDTLLSENRIDEALSIIELEDENLQRLRFEEDCPVDDLRLFSSEVSERKAMLTLQLTMVAENRRIAAPELQKALVGLCRLVKTISEISGGLSTAVEAVQFAMSFCSLLETQRLVLRPYLIKHIRPCMEEVLHKHLDHFKKVIDIFTATDAWVWVDILYQEL
ncbi:exocyst complex component EXO84B-like [Prunus yedoensis var. nudiflora]|uniref:Exocyst complex component EXO84B-like n=1 Tax=Prunus yedoensis var. nudiflora TaxID=2094558 RepID=A0A314UPK5_PRUYE|nr:exocyst complex component EXO84B-like [Prunus yedoensis var. nudiflora]